MLNYQIYCRQHGMTALQNAAYKGNKEMCQLLLNHGADVNTNRHDHGYTPLMFAALSGKMLHYFCIKLFQICYAVIIVMD